MTFKQGKITAFTTMLLLISSPLFADEVPDWADAGLQKWYEAYNNRDVQALAAMYAKNAQAGGQVGRDAIIANFQQDWAEQNLSCTGKHTGFLLIGNFAAAKGEDTCTSVDGDSKNTQIIRWLSISERQENGLWLTVRDESENLEE